MNQIIKLLGKLNNGVADMSIRGAPRCLLLIYAMVFIAMGLVYIIGLVTELQKTGHVNYRAINDFVDSYFGMASVAAFGVIGKALIDSNKDGRPDVWEQTDAKK